MIFITAGFITKIFITKLFIAVIFPSRSSSCHLQALNCQFYLVKFVNLSVSCLGIFGRSADSFIDICKDSDINKDKFRFIIRKASNIIFQSTYFILAAETNHLTFPDLISF